MKHLFLNYILKLSRFSEEKMFNLSYTRNQSISIFRKPIWFQYIVFLSFFLNPFSGKAQQYYPMVMDSVHWLIAGGIEANGVGTYNSIWEYYSLEDTVVSTLIYKKIYKRDIQSVNSNYMAPYQPISPFTLFALIREDTLTRKVYTIILQNPSGLFCPLNQEVLFFDFDLNAGDTINTCVGGSWEGNPCAIVFKDPSTKWGYNTNIYTRQCLMPIEFYEGIGHMGGLFENEDIAEATTIWDYCRGADITCGLTTNITEFSLIKPSFSIFPNPATEYIQLKSTQLSSQTIEFEIYINDLFGKVVKHTEVTYKDKIDISTLKKGIYFIKILNQQHETLYTSKIIKL